MLQFKVITDLDTEPVTISDAKSFLNIDFDDWDGLLTMLIKASRIQSEKVTGQAYGLKVIQVTGNTFEERIYPVGPYISNETWEGEDNDKDYRYNAGFTDCPEDLKLAILQRVATGFAQRENGTNEAMNMALNASIISEMKYKDLLAW
jgi:predicted N-acyltransferase